MQCPAVRSASGEPRTLPNTIHTLDRPQNQHPARHLTSFFPVLISSSDMGRRHCSGMLKRSRSDGRTPSHLMSGVVRLELSYDMFMDPGEFMERHVAMDDIIY